MQKQTFIIIFVLISVVIAALLLMAFRNPDKNRNKEGEKCPDGKTPVPDNGICPQQSIGTNAVADETGCKQPSSYINFSYPIKFGMMDGGNTYDNKEVSRLQKQLNTIYKSGLLIDGKFGCNTLGSVKKHLGVSEVSYQNPIWNAKPILG